MAIGYSAGHAFTDNLSAAPGGTDTFVSKAFTNAFVGGEVAGMIVQHAADEAITFSDGTNSWSQQVRVYSAALGFDLAIGLAKNCAAGGPYTVNASWASNVARAAIIFSITGGDITVQPVGTPLGAISSGAAPPDPGMSVATSAGDLIIGAVIDASATDIAAGSGYTRQLRAANAAAYQWCIEDQIAGGAGPYNPNWTTSLNFWAAVGIVIKAAAGGGGGPNVAYLYHQPKSLMFVD